MARDERRAFCRDKHLKFTSNPSYPSLTQSLPTTADSLNLSQSSGDRLTQEETVFRRELLEDYRGKERYPRRSACWTKTTCSR